MPRANATGAAGGNQFSAFQFPMPPMPYIPMGKDIIDFYQSHLFTFTYLVTAGNYFVTSVF